MKLMRFIDLITELDQEPDAETQVYINSTLVTKNNTYNVMSTVTCVKSDDAFVLEIDLDESRVGEEVCSDSITVEELIACFNTAIEAGNVHPTTELKIVATFDAFNKPVVIECNFNDSDVSYDEDLYAIDIHATFDCITL